MWTEQDKKEELERINIALQKSNRRLLFCDIDGVLNSAAWYEIRSVAKDERALKIYQDKLQERNRNERITDDNPCEPHIGALNKLKEKVPGLEIVLSSTWRTEMNSYGWDRFFSTLGIDIPVTGKTDRLGSFRGPEILNYLIEQKGKFLYDAHCKNNNPCEPVIGFAVLDDDYDYTFDFIKSNWYLVNSEIGFIEKDVDKLTEILLKPIKWPEGI